MPVRSLIAARNGSHIDFRFWEDSVEIMPKFNVLGSSACARPDHATPATAVLRMSVRIRLNMSVLLVSNYFVQTGCCTGKPRSAVCTAQRSGRQRNRSEALRPARRRRQHQRGLEVAVIQIIEKGAVQRMDRAVEMDAACLQRDYPAAITHGIVDLMQGHHDRPA